MRANSIISFIIALVFGALAVVVANIWLQSQSRKTEVTVATPNVETATLVVAGTDLSFGMELKPELLREIPWPAADLPDGSYRKINDVLGGGRRVALASISPNEPLLKWKISGPDARASLSAVVTEGMRAVAMRINDVVGVGGFVLPGDRVDVLYTNNGATDVLIQNVRILAVNQIVDQKKSDPVVANVATVEVNTVDAQKIALAQTTGSLSLTLRSAGSLDQAKPQKVVEAELVSSPSVYEAEFNARAAAQAAIDEKLNKLAQSVADATSGKAELEKKLADLEQRVRDTASATGQGEEALRAKLAELEQQIKDAVNGGGQDEKALRAKLAEFEAALGKLTNTPVVMAVSDNTVTPVRTTATIGVTRGIKRDTYEVPLDVTSEEMQ